MRSATADSRPEDVTDSELESALAAALQTGVRVRRRSRSPYSSTSPLDVLVCEVGSTARRELLCKWAVGDPLHQGPHRGGVDYEAAVYRSWVDPLPGTPQIFHGHGVTASGASFLLLEHLPAAARLNHSVDADALELVAEWLGRVHAHGTLFTSTAAAAFLTRYDEHFYAGWVERTEAYTDHRRHPWVRRVCSAAPAMMTAELGREPTVIHGELYPENVLVQAPEVIVVDWESAAVAAGEIDLAALVSGWPPELREAAISRYLLARWGAEPACFSRVYDVSRLYLAFRWLGDRREWTDLADPYFESLLEVAEVLELT